MSSLIKIRHVGERGAAAYPNFYLTHGYTLIVFHKAMQHELALREIGLRGAQILISGYINPHGAHFRAQYEAFDSGFDLCKRQEIMEMVQAALRADEQQSRSVEIGTAAAYVSLTFPVTHPGKQ